MLDVILCDYLCLDGHALCKAGTAGDQRGPGSARRDVAEKSRHALYPQLEW